VCQGLDVLVRLDHYVVTLDTQCSLCCAQRTSAAFERTSDIEACFGRIEQALASVPRARYMLLVDARTGPGRNDSSFEAVVAEQRGKLLFGFARNAALAATAAGRLQIQRYAKADGRTVFATGSPEEAFAYLGLSFHPI
jgi:hypothetical protein